MTAVNRKTAWARIKRGWDPERANTEPPCDFAAPRPYRLGTATRHACMECDAVGHNTRTCPRLEGR